MLPRIKTTSPAKTIISTASVVDMVSTYMRDGGYLGLRHRGRLGPMLIRLPRCEPRSPAESKQPRVCDPRWLPAFAAADTACSYRPDRAVSSWGGLMGEDG